MRNARLMLLLVLIGISGLIWYAVISFERNELKIVFLDVGQGDAIYIEAPNGNQMIIDGGPDGSILRELGEVMPFFDRSIDVLMVSNPDADHFAGFVDVLERFEVGYVIEPGTKSETKVYALFEEKIKEEPASKIIVRRGMKIDLGSGVVFTVLFPDRDVSGVTPNDGSIIGKLTYGETSIMFTGDTTEKIEEYLVSLDGALLDSDLLKVAHHGSHTSSAEDFVRAVSPTAAIISAGEGNRYGHPHADVLNTFEKFGIEVFGTYEKGRVTILSDGVTIRVK